jgi:hypothetical protein
MTTCAPSLSGPSASIISAERRTLAVSLLLGLLLRRP